MLFIKDSLHLLLSTEHNHSIVEDIWRSFSNREMVYDQIRYLDIDGNEVVRINQSKVGAYIVSPGTLQNKKDRYYFQETIGLANNQLYLTKMDLNMENNVIQLPIKPMLRLATPIFAPDGPLEGIVVLNYLAEDMLKHLRSGTANDHGVLYLLNADGYWLYNSEDRDKEWTFMYEDRTAISFANEFPAEWSAIQAGESSFLVSGNGVFNYIRLLTGGDLSSEVQNGSLVLGSGDWYLVSYLSADTQDGQLFTDGFWLFLYKVIRNYAYVYGMILLIAFVIAFLLSLNQQQKEKLEYMSRFDAMTGVYNRRAGLEKLSRMRAKQKESHCGFCVCFIDINGLKEVNDTFGHESGDELILSVVQGIQTHIRETDFIARLGGDEFLVIISGLSTKVCEEIWTRIDQEYAHINETENRSYLISASHGIEVMDCSVHHSIDDIINSADEKMYLEKKRIKQTLTVIRSTSPS
ncbi:MAG: GGDEF domain-containing protein [Eubacteriales bacterium]|nr:GGDEF domain-containing protein [Eubacteriales bacterium]